MPTKTIDGSWEPPEHKSVQAALIAAQLEFGSVTKGSVNPAFKSKYADLADVASVVIPTLNRHGVAVYHMVENDAMKTVFHHASSGTEIACAVPLVVDKQNMQGMKSATTYAKRIGLESLSGVAPEDDDGNAAAAAPPARTITQEQIDAIENVMAEIPDLNRDGFLKYMGVKVLKDLPAGKYQAAIAALDKKRVR
jgi:mono/diheme cytochrome c family protein